MVQWGIGHRITFSGQHGDISPKLPSLPVKEEREQDDREAPTVESLITTEVRKKKRLTLSELKEARAARSGKQRKSTINHKRRQNKNDSNSIDRWSAERYKLAEQSMLDVMRAEGAVFRKPISRPALRVAARKHIGDTGLLDHLLKHIDGKVAPGGVQRFRRCYNTSGVMEYWLESADLANIRQEAGVQDPNWVPPSWWKPGGGPFEDSVSAVELKLLQAELAKVKRDMQALLSQQQEQPQANPAEEMHKELVKWKTSTDQRLIEISNSLSSVQEMYRDLLEWKTKIEQQLSDLSNSLDNKKASNHCTTFSPASARWENWLDSTVLANIQADEFAPWFENTDLVNVEQEAVVQDPYLAPPPWSTPNPTDSHSRDMVCYREPEEVKTNRDVKELAGKSQEEDQTNVTPDSSVTANSKPDVDSSLLRFQEMFNELVTWKSKMEQQLTEISNSVIGMQAL